MASQMVASVASHDEILALFARQQTHQWVIRKRSATERVQKLNDLKRAIVRHREAILDAMHADFRKNRSETELSEIQLVFTELNEAIKRAAGWMKPVPVATPVHLMGTRSEIRFEPRGVVLIMAAWNYPFALIFAPLVAAVAAGNCVIVRPSDKVPHTSEVARQIIAEAFAPDEVAMISGPQSTADTLLALPFDHVFFTGSTPVGRKIMAAAAPHLSSVTLELGGKSPAIVDETAHIEQAASRIMWGKFVNAGQTCVAPDYAFVHAAKADEFFAACRRVLSSFYGATDEARRQSGDYCRMIDAGNWTRVTTLVAEAVRAGAKLEAGGQADEAERYIAPTILSNVAANSPIMTDEIFGPVLPVLTYRSLEEILSFLHARPKPLAMYVFSRSDVHIQEVLARTSAGGTVINNCLIHLINPGLPFGGTGDSGFGRYHGRFGFETFSHARAVLVQGRFSLAHVFYPPYARLRSGWLGAVMQLARRIRD
jgi:aldehyde dehydrogenase (NAD+)